MGQRYILNELSLSLFGTGGHFDKLYLLDGYLIEYFNLYFGKFALMYYAKLYYGMSLPINLKYNFIWKMLKRGRIRLRIITNVQVFYAKFCIAIRKSGYPLLTRSADMFLTLGN